MLAAGAVSPREPRWLRGTNASPRRDAEPEGDHSAQTALEPTVRCATCGHVLALRRDRVSVDGAHRHTFVNPVMVVFKIACFRRADGATPVGVSSDEWTWFADHRWRVALCGACQRHVGWQFLSHGRSFFGLAEDAIASDP